MIMTLSSEKIGIPQGPMEWSNQQQKHVPVSYKDVFLKQVQRSVTRKTNEDSRSVANEEGLRVYCCDTIGDVQHYHLNYLSYLEKCWADHLGVVITPDIVWYTLLAEIAIIVKNGPETFRHLFSKSKEKENIIVFSGDPVVMPLDTLVNALKDRVPTDTVSFFPEFSTQTPKSLHAFQAAFCDMCSPYYNYMMYCCNIPMIDVRGTLDDWKNLSDKWNKLLSVVFGMGVTDWMNDVTDVLSTLVDNFKNQEFWKQIFSIKHCGSGHQTVVSGWFSKFFNIQPRIKYVENYSAHVSIVKYKQLNFDQNFEMLVGMFGSKKEDEFMVPDFSFVVNEVV